MATLILRLLTILNIILLFDIKHINGFSACDEIDITFVVDVDSIVANEDGVIKYITSIIWSGSSEHTGFSVVIYGENIPNDQKIKIVSLHDTQDKTQRQHAEKEVDKKLKAAFNNIINSRSQHRRRRILRVSSGESHDPDPLRKWTSMEKKKSESDEEVEKGVDKSSTSTEQESEENNNNKDSEDSVHNGNDGTKSVSLLTAFKIATGQSRPEHLGIRKAKLGYSSDDPAIGDHDNQQVYIIFDHNNNILKVGDDEMFCKLVNHLDHNQIKNDDEAPYFMLGHSISTSAKDELLCNDKLPSYLHDDTFFYFDKDFAFSQQKMEKIYTKTCPAEVNAPEYNGKINVGNHVQYIDVDTVIKCKLIYWDNDNDESTPPVLDTDKSYIRVKDYINDDNTFKIKDHLVITPEKIKAMKRIGCKEAVIRIENIVHDDTNEYGTSDSDESNDYKILKVYLSLPEAPMSYIQDANVHGNARLHRKNFRKHNDERYRYQHADQPRPDPDEWSKTDEDELEEVTEPNKDKHDSFEDEEESELQYKQKEYRNYEMDDGKSGAHAMTINTMDDNYEAHNYNEREILKGEMDDLMASNGFAAHLGEFILKDRKQRMKRIFQKIVNLKKIVKRITNRKKRKINGRGTFGARALNAGDDLVQQQTVMMGFFDALLTGKLRFSGAIPLFKIDFRREWLCLKRGKKVSVFGDPKPEGWDLRATGRGTIMIRFGYIFRFVIGVRFLFEWQIYTPLVVIEFVVFIEWDVGAYFYVNVGDRRKASIIADNLLNYGRDIRFSIGPIPVLLRPYFKIFIQLKSIKKPFWGGIKCRYNERLELGYRYDNRPWGRRGPIARKVRKHKGCKKKLGLHQSIRDREMQCPAPEDRITGFDIGFNVQIGCILYKIINVWLRMEFVIPFRVTVPEMNPRKCGIKWTKDICKIGPKTEWLKAHFTISMHLNIYMGIGVDFTQIFHLIKGLITGKKSAAGPWRGPKFEKKLVGPIPLIPKISLGCIDLKKHLQELDTAWRQSCCNGFNHHKKYLTIDSFYHDQKYDDQFMYDYDIENNYRYQLDNPEYDSNEADYYHNDMKNPYYDQFYLMRHEEGGHLLISSDSEERREEHGFDAGPKPIERKELNLQNYPLKTFPRKKPNYVDAALSDMKHPYRIRRHLTSSIINDSNSNDNQQLNNHHTVDHNLKKDDG